MSVPNEYRVDLEKQKFRQLSDESILVATMDIVANSLVPEKYDYISLSYTGSNLTGVVFRSGGSGGTVVAILALAYSGSNLVSVTKT